MPPPGQPVPLRDRAQQAFNQDQYVEAADLARQALVANPRDADALRILGASLFVSAAEILRQHPGSEIQRQQIDNGLDYLEQALTVQPDDPKILTTVGTCNVLIGR